MQAAQEAKVRSVRTRTGAPTTTARSTPPPTTSSATDSASPPAATATAAAGGGVAVAAPAVPFDRARAGCASGDGGGLLLPAAR